MMKKHFPLLILVLVNLIVGLLALPSFGESVDELSQHSYAERTLQGISSPIATGPWPAYFTEETSKQGSHGPIFMMVVVLLRRLFLPEGTHREGTVFYVRLIADVTDRADCRIESIPFRLEVPLNIVNLPEGPCEVNVNGMTASFDPRARPASSANLGD